MKSDTFFWLRSVLAAAILATPLIAWAVPSVTADTKVDRISVGIGGIFKVGLWTSLKVNLGPRSPARVRLKVEAPDPEGSVVTYQSEPIQLQQTGPNVLSVLFKMGRLGGTIHVRVVADGSVLFNRQLRVSADPDADLAPPLPQSVFSIGHVRAPAASGTHGTDRVAALLSGDNANLPEGSASPATRPAIEVVDIDSLDSLPTNSAACASLDAILLDGGVELDLAHSQAIEEWVRSGGHLIVTLGKSGQAFSKSPLATWIPIKVQGVQRLSDLSSIESFGRQSSRIMSAGDEPIDVARLNDAGGKTLISSFEGSLLGRASYGLGRVTVFAIDVENPQLLRWGGMGDLLRRMIDLEEPQSKRAQPIAARLTQTGVTELATQLDATQDEFPSVARVTTWPVMGLLVALLLVIGPLDYLIVHKLFHRPELTWVTFPLFAIAAAGSAILWGTWAKGDRLLVNQLDVVDVDTVSGATRARSCSLLYSPENRRYNVSVEPDSINSIASSAGGHIGDLNAGGPRVGWHGRPESSFGGMYRSGGAEIARAPYSSQPGDRGLEGVPIAVWSAKNLETEWEGRTSGLVDNQLESHGPSRLEGTLRHHFPEPIEDWIVAYGHQVFRPRTDPKTGRALPLAPDVPWSPQTASQRELAGYLTGATRVPVKPDQPNLAEESRVEHADYDPLDRDPVAVMRMLTFHREAGATLYTGLGNGALSNYDWTPFLDLDRAVLVGRIRRPAIRWTVDGKRVEPETHVTFVRLLLPVRKTRED
ncbi:MAG TPA: hypothetical protein VMR25_23405 [Planctomycetaceae bacterium]|nr:hypothetical protein [Planctomycetaceae bacterium]